MLLAGCAKSPPKEATADLPKAPQKVTPDEPKRLFTGPGTATARQKEEPRSVRYEISWKSSTLDYTQAEGAKSGELIAVTGKLFQNGKLASTFTADRASANQETNVLKLEGNVNVRGLEPAGTLKCNRLEWHTNEKLLKAFGAVTITGKVGRIGPLDELWCLPDLRRAGTPGFRQ